MQIVLKNEQCKIPYIVDSGYKKRGCYTRNINYYKFEEKILEIIRKICKSYVNKSMLEETYKKMENKPIDMLLYKKRERELIENKIKKNNKIMDELYGDKLKRDINRVRLY